MEYLKLKEQLESKVFSGIAGYCPLSPNMITLFSVFLAFFSGYLVLEGRLVLAAGFFGLSCLLDALDGQVARVKGKKSRFGSFFDKTADRIVDMTLLSSVVLAGIVPAFPGVFTLCVVVLASYASAVLEAESGKKRIGEGLSLRPVRSLVLFAGLATGFVAEAVFLLLVIGFYSLEKRILTARRML